MCGCCEPKKEEEKCKEEKKEEKCKEEKKSCCE